MKGQTYVIVGIIIVIIVAVFAVTNVGVVDVNYLFWSVESPLILVILFSVLMGVLISAAVASYKIIQLQRELRRFKSNQAKMEDVLAKHDLLDEFNEDVTHSGDTPLKDK